MSAESDVSILLEELVAGEPAKQNTVVVSGPSGVAEFPAGSVPVVNTEVAPAAPNDDYLVLCDEIVNRLDMLTANTEQIDRAADQDGRLAAALLFIKNQQELNEKLYAAWVEMSNMLAKQN